MPEEIPEKKKQIKTLHIQADEDHVALQFYRKKGDLQKKPVIICTVINKLCKKFINKKLCKIRTSGNLYTFRRSMRASMNRYYMKIG